MLALPQKVGVWVGLRIFTSVNWSLLLLLEFSLIMWSFRSRSTCFLPMFAELLDLRSVDDPFLGLPRPFLGLVFLGEILIKVSKAVSTLGFSCCWKKNSSIFYINSHWCALDLILLWVEFNFVYFVFIWYLDYRYK